MGGGIGMGNTCKPMAVSFQCMTKFTTNKKKKRKKKKKKQCCDEHWGARVSFRSGFLSVYAQQWDCWVIWQF